MQCFRYLVSFFACVLLLACLTGAIPIPNTESVSSTDTAGTDQVQGKFLGLIARIGSAIARKIGSKAAKKAVSKATKSGSKEGAKQAATSNSGSNIKHFTKAQRRKFESKRRKLVKLRSKYKWT